MVETLIVSYNAHTTDKDAEFVIRDFRNFQPDVFIPQEPGRTYKELADLTRYYKELVRGDRELKRGRIFYNFHKTLIDSFRECEKEIKFHFLEAHSEEKAAELRTIHDQELKHRKRAQSFFNEDNVDEACNEIYQSLFLKSKSAKIRARNIEENALNLSRDVFDKYPELSDNGEVIVQAVLSGVYLPPVVQLVGAAPVVIKIPQKSPYTSLTHVGIVRSMVLGKDVSKDDIPKYFLENTIERKLRDNIPDSIERFEFCRNVSEKLSGKNINKRRVEETLNSLAIGIKTQ